MPVGLHLAPLLQNHSILIQKKGRPLNTPIRLPVIHLLDPDPNLVYELPPGVSQDREVEFELPSELHVGGNGVRAHAKDLNTIELREFITELSGLNRSPRGVVLGIEEQNRLVTLEIAK